ncbi:DNA-binding response regulator [Tenacibaculum sp. 190130A14a]|uniref:Two-component system, LytTR family, response regulator n=1 Tax=Tenacibaculum polynesiense TaxID=3137857 RepID=A0ABP1EZG5_9FLAO
MKTFRCILADDEPIARQILENYIQDIPNLELVASCKNAFEVMEVLQKETIDVLFLDINMPKLSGISLLKTMQHRPEVIITTAYPEYAIEGFELSVTDYLLKPFSLERFLQSIAKLNKNVMLEKRVVSSEVSKEQSIFVKSDKKTIKLYFDEITHIEAYGNYIKIFADEMILTPLTLSDFLIKLSSDFIRIHKSYVVNFNHLKLIDGNQFVLRNNVKLPIGKSYRKLVAEKVNN